MTVQSTAPNAPRPPRPLPAASPATARCPRRDIYESGLANLTTGSSVDSVVALMNQTFYKLLLDPQQKQFRSLLADTYLATINYNNIQNLNGTAGGDGGGGGGSPSWLPIAIVLPTVGALLLIAAGVVYEVGLPDCPCHAMCAKPRDSPPPGASCSPARASRTSLHCGIGGARHDGPVCSRPTNV